MLLKNYAKVLKILDKNKHYAIFLAYLHFL